MIARFFFPSALPAGGCVALPEALAHHAVRVLRLRDGDAVVLFDGSGAEWPARLAVRGRECSAELEDCRFVERESPLQVVLVQALAAGDKMDWVVQKAVELGVHAVQPLSAARSVLRLAGERAERRVAHWQQVAVAACEQCGRNRVPSVRGLSSLADYLAASATERRVVLAPGGAVGLAALAPPRSGEALHLLVGPEGGWSEDELALCTRAGVTALALGPRVLRTETAGLAALAALQARWGDFG